MARNRLTGGAWTSLAALSPIGFPDCHSSYLDGVALRGTATIRKAIPAIIPLLVAIAIRFRHMLTPAFQGALCPRLSKFHGMRRSRFLKEVTNCHYQQYVFIFHSIISLSRSAILMELYWLT